MISKVQFGRSNFMREIAGTSGTLMLDYVPPLAGR